MASIQKRDNGKWRARYRDEAGKEHARHFARKVDAQRWLDETTASLVTGQYVDPRAGTVTVRDYAERWRSLQKHRPGTQDQVRLQFKNHVYPTLASHQLKNVRPSHIQELHRAWDEKGLSASTQSVLYRHVSAVFKAAVADRVIAVSPCQVTHSKPVSKKVTPLRTEDVERLLAVMPLPWRAMAVLAAGTGMRQGECFGLTLDRISFERATVTVDRQLTTSTRSGPEFSPPKTPSSNREIPLPKVVVSALTEHVEMFGVDPDGLLFRAALGGRLRRQPFNAMFKRATEEAGVKATFHDFRHYYASLLIRHGESVKTVQARLGHKSATETLDTYSHLWEDSDDRTRAAVDQVLTFVNLADSVRTAPRPDAG